MAVRKREAAKVVEKNTGGTFLSVKQVPKTEGHGNKKRTSGSTYGLFSGKHNVKDGFKNTEEAREFAIANVSKYNRKTKKFD